MTHLHPTTRPTRQRGELANVIGLSLRARNLTPTQLARLLFPLPRRPGGPDQKAARHRALARQLAALLRQEPAPADLNLDTATALALDRVLGLPTGYCALVATLDRVLLALAPKRTVARRLAPPSPPSPLNVGYAVIVPRPDGSSVAFADGRLPAD